MLLLNRNIHVDLKNDQQFDVGFSLSSKISQVTALRFQRPSPFCMAHASFHSLGRSFRPLPEIFSHKRVTTKYGDVGHYSCGNRPPGANIMIRDLCIFHNAMTLREKTPDVVKMAAAFESVSSQFSAHVCHFL